MTNKKTIRKEIENFKQKTVEQYFVHTCGYDLVIDQINADVTFTGTKKECEFFIENNKLKKWFEKIHKDVQASNHDYLILLEQKAQLETQIAELNKKLSQEAEEYLHKDGTETEKLVKDMGMLCLTKKQFNGIIAIFKQIYIDSAKPREKRIAVLEAQIEKMRNCRNCRKHCEGYRNCTLQNLCYWEWDNGDIH